MRDRKRLRSYSEDRSEVEARVDEVLDGISGFAGLPVSLKQSAISEQSHLAPNSDVWPVAQHL